MTLIFYNYSYNTLRFCFLVQITVYIILEEHEMDSGSSSKRVCYL